MVVTQVAKWGNSLGVRLPKSVLNEACIHLEDEVMITCENGAIVITKAEKELTIRDLFADYREPGVHYEKEIDFGKPEGEEIW